MSQNLLYKIDKAVKQNTDTNEIAMICREYLSKFPKNIRVLKILNNIKLSQNKEIFSKMEHMRCAHILAKTHTF